MLCGGDDIPYLHDTLIESAVFLYGKGNEGDSIHHVDNRRLQSLPYAGRDARAFLDIHYHEAGLEERDIYGDQTDLSDIGLYAHDINHYAE